MFSELIEIKSELNAKFQGSIESQNFPIPSKKYATKPGKASIINDPKFPLRSQKIRDDKHGPTRWISITITEGKFRQVRKMTAAVGFPTLRLIRIRIGNILLDDLKIGSVKEMNSFN